MLELEALEAEIVSLKNHHARASTVEDLNRRRDFLNREIIRLEQDPPELVHAKESAKHGSKGGRTPFPPLLLAEAQRILDQVKGSNPNSLKKTCVGQVVTLLVSGPSGLLLPPRYKYKLGNEALFGFLYTRLKW